jgi:shikimate kinase
MPTFRTSVQVKLTDVGLPHLILVGLPGAGKTAVGRAVAEKLGRSFLDFDDEIERREGATISEIFGSKGEQHFRKLEHRLTEELARTSGMIVAPGGGWIMNPDVVGLVRPPARIVYLKLRPETSLARLGALRSTRPLLMRADPLAELKLLLQQRAPAYETADATVGVELLSLQRVIESVIELADPKSPGGTPQN